MVILENLTETELTHIFSVLGFTEVKYRFEGRTSPGQEVANSRIDPATGDVMEYRKFMKYDKHNKVWKHFFANELVRLVQGVGKRVKGMDTVFFVDYNYIPSESRKDITYGRIMVDYRPQKKDPNRTILTVGVNIIE